MRMAEIETDRIYTDDCGQTVTVLEKNIRTDWHRGRPRTSVLVRFEDGRTAMIESRHIKQPEGA